MGFGSSSICWCDWYINLSIISIKVMTNIMIFIYDWGRRGEGDCTYNWYSPLFWLPVIWAIHQLIDWNRTRTVHLNPKPFDRRLRRPDGSIMSKAAEISKSTRIFIFCFCEKFIFAILSSTGLLPTPVGQSNTQIYICVTMHLISMSL